MVRIDCLNGDKYKTGKVAPDGSPDPSIFSTDGDPVGIQVGTAIATLIRKAHHKPERGDWIPASVGAGQIGGTALDGRGRAGSTLRRDQARPAARTAVRANGGCATSGFDWPALPDLFPVSFPGVQTCRDSFLVDIDIDRLRARVRDYFDPDVSHEEMARRHPGVMKSTARFDARATRTALIARGGPDEAGFVRFAYRPLDTRWLYWEKDTKLLDEKRADYRPHVFEGNLWLSAAQHLRKGADEPQTCSTRHLGCRHLIERGALLFPAWLPGQHMGRRC